MKRMFISAIALLFIFGTAVSQDVERQYVMLEKFTGVACPPCAAMAGDLDKAVEDGCDFAIIEYHQYRVDQYSTPFGAIRNNFYPEITGYPALFFDGEHTGNMMGRDWYETIVEYYNRLSKVKSPLFIEVEKTQGATLNDWSFNVKVTRKNSAFTDVDNLKLFVAITESDIRQIWGSGASQHNRLNHVFRTTSNMDGDNVTFSNDLFEKSMSISLVDNIQIGNCEAVFFVQDIQTREVIQAYKVKLIGDDINVNTPVVTKVAQLPGSQSMLIEWTAPSSKAANLLGYNVYDKSDQKVNRSGIITSTTSYVTKKIAVSDEKCYYVTAVYDLLESADSNRECARLSLLTAPQNFDTIARGNKGNTITFTWEAPEGYGAGSGNEANIAGYDIYRNSVKINSEPVEATTYQDIVTQVGKHAYYIVAIYQNELVADKLESPKTNPIVVDVETTVSVNNISDVVVNVYPNPITSGSININIEYDGFTITDAIGRIVIESNQGYKQVNVESLQKGIYLLTLKIGNAQKSVKIIKQ